MRRKGLLFGLVLAALLLLLAGCKAPDAEQKVPAPDNPTKISVVETGSYISTEEVALYIQTYQKLPANFITKAEAEKLGWISSKGNLDEVAPGKSIGGNRFGNYEGLLPSAKGRTWTECDINYKGGHRGAERLVFSNDGLIYYTKDHYETFEQVHMEGP